MSAQPKTGSLTVPNVGLGDIEITFNQFDVSELAKATRMLKDMQRRGYAILVRLEDGSYARAQEIDERRGRYVIMVPGYEVPSETAEPEPQAVIPAEHEEDSQVATPPPPEAEKPTKGRRGRPRKVRMPIATSHATGVARSAGG